MNEAKPIAVQFADANELINMSPSGIFYYESNQGLLSSNCMRAIADEMDKRTKEQNNAKT